MNAPVKTPRPEAGTLRPATPDDIAFIMRTERSPGYPELVGTYDKQTHLRLMAMPLVRYVVYELDRAPLGFAELRRDVDGMGNVQLHRLAVAPAGRGHGALFLSALCADVFSDPEIGRIWLDLLPDNLRARRVYEKTGFRIEGTMRSALRLPDGTRRDLLLMGHLRND